MRARTAAETDWHRIAELYRELAELTRSPIVELNRAIDTATARCLNNEILMSRCRSNGGLD